MCGRYVTPDELQYFLEKYGDDFVNDLLQAGLWVPKKPDQEQTQIPFNISRDGYFGQGLASYNAAPSQMLPVITENGLELMKWEYQVRIWDVKQKKLVTKKLYPPNATAEKLQKSKNFKESFEKRRCLIPARGFYEWKKLQPELKAKSPKQPYFIHLKEFDMFSFAGIWKENVDEDGVVEKGFVIITTEPNDFMKFYHHRMASILHPDQEDEWLCGTDLDALQQMALTQFPSEGMDAYKVGPAVGNAVNNSPVLLERLD